MYLQVAQPVRARVELRLVCRVLVSSANLWVLPRPDGGKGFEGDDNPEDLWFPVCQSMQVLVANTIEPIATQQTYQTEKLTQETCSAWPY